MFEHSLVQDHMPRVVGVRPRKSWMNWMRPSHWPFCSIWWSHANLPTLRIRRMPRTAMPWQRRTGRPTLRVEIVIWGFNSDVSIDDIWMFSHLFRWWCCFYCKTFGKNGLFVGWPWLTQFQLESWGCVSVPERRCPPNPSPGESWSSCLGLRWGSGESLVAWWVES